MTRSCASWSRRSDPYLCACRCIACGWLSHLIEGSRLAQPVVARDPDHPQPTRPRPSEATTVGGKWSFPGSPWKEPDQSRRHPYPLPAQLDISTLGSRRRQDRAGRSRLGSVTTNRAPALDVHILYRLCCDGVGVSPRVSGLARSGGFSVGICLLPGAGRRDLRCRHGHQQLLLAA